jgi:uncharacterized protein YabN with tetrapyrrole methylase and pyrophosphatase domain
MSGAAHRRLRASARRPRGEGARRGSLTIVGTGIGLVGQATLEAADRMSRCEKLLHLVANPVMEAWVRGLNPTAESLADCYAPGKPRAASYAEMVERILSAVRTGADVCVAFYGHPGVFVNPSHRAIRLARLEGFHARMLPGVSAEDCLFADLGVDPADAGCQSFEATDFLEAQRTFDPSSTLVLWQIAAIRQNSVDGSQEIRQRGLKALARFLQRRYPRHHEVVVYEAAQLPICDPIIMRVPLSELGRTVVPALATLYVPPLRNRGDGARRIRKIADRRRTADTG